MSRFTVLLQFNFLLHFVPDAMYMCSNAVRISLVLLYNVTLTHAQAIFAKLSQLAFPN